MNYGVNRRWLWAACQWSITLGLLVWLFWSFSWRTFVETLQTASPGFYVIAFVGMTAGQLLYVLRWHLILRVMGLQMPFWSVTRCYFIGLFFNNFLPTVIGGDGFRIYYLGDETGYLKATVSVLLDRCLGFFALALIAALLTWLVPFDTPSFGWVRTVVTAIAASFVGLIVFLNMRWSDAIVDILPDRPIWGTQPKQRLAVNLPIIRAVAGRVPLLMICLVLVFVFYLCLAGVYSVYFAQTAGLLISLRVILSVEMVLLCIALLANIPLAINGIGLREQLHYLMFAALGLPKEVAVSISLILFFNMLLLSAVGYLALVHTRLARKKTNAMGNCSPGDMPSLNPPQ